MFNIFSWLRLAPCTRKFFFYGSLTITFLFIQAILASDSNAQQGPVESKPDQYRAVHWTIYDGLSNGFGNVILKDVNGFLWIGTLNGLNRFDGNLFKNYYHDPHNSRSIAGNFITGIKEDSLHNIWIGSDRGLSRYDIKADSFKNILTDPKAGSDQFITPFWTTKDNLYVVESGSRINAYNIHSFEKTPLINLKETDSLTSVQYSIFDPVSNSIWMLHGYRGVAGGGLLNISLPDGKRRYYNWPCYRKIPQHSHASEEMRYDPKRNAIWINSPDGLMEFTLADKQFHHINGTNDLNILKDQAGIDIDTLGRIWLATDQKGILIYNPSAGSLSIPFPDDPVMQHDISEFNKMIYCDKDGMTWCGTWTKKGFYQLIPFSPAVKLYTPDPKQALGVGSNMVINIAKAGNGKLWIGTFNGLYQFEKNTEELKVLDLKKFQGLKVTKAIVPDYTDPGLGKAWFNTDAVFYEMDMQTQKCRPVIFEDITGKTIHLTRYVFFFPFRNGWIIIGDYNNKEYIFTGNYNSIIAREALSFANNNVDDAWAATDNYHLLFIQRDEGFGNLTFSYRDGKWAGIPHKMDSIQWTSIFFDKQDSTYWVAAERRLIHYNRDFKIIRTYDHSDGLPDIGITGLIADNSGNIWFHTDRAIHQLNIATGEISTLTKKDGFEKQNFELMKYNYKDDNGDIYFPSGGGGSGFDRITPGNYTNRPSSIYLQSLEVNQKSFPLSTGINNLQELSLRYNENKITIETGIIDYYSKGSSHIRYKLEENGKNENWQYGPANYTIRFDGLQPGKYILRMQASNAALQFNGPEKTLLIHISPPFWQTWWFRIVAILFAAALLYGFIQYRSRNLKQRNIVLEEKVMQRTNELHNSLAELKTTQDQLIQSEKMASLGELTSGIAHEIKNPLNFINNFSEINVELLTEIEEEQIPVLNETDKTEITENIKTLKKNSEKINQHGKRLDGIVKSMLQHSRLGNTNKEVVNINALCDESLKLAYHGFRAKEKTFNASFETQFDPDLPKIMVIPQDFGRVMLNLINNAFYTVNEKKKRIQSESSADALEAELLYKPSVIVSTKRSGNKIIVTVSDNGIGIPPAIINKIFQPFFTTKPTGEGTGLGLSMSYDIITKSHGGELRAKSKEGIGTDFEIILPI